ncbi:dihydrodipicolinate synthase family protein [Tropicimonas sp.]|uniref:dihydrodipicolinate synthase family protein n=1 Tax=Tropicimonas sp. TaxID=2067044 RepID=UPI003A85C884
MLSECKGLHVVAQTPFTDAGQIDFDSIATLSAFYFRHGARGLTVLGVSGEAAKLTADETIAVAARFAAVSGGRRIIAGVSNASLATLAAVTRDVLAEGVGAVMICPPGNVQTDEEFVAYFGAVFDRIGDVPVVLQDFPFHSGARMSVPLICELLDRFPQIGAIKEEDLPSVGKITRLRREMRRQVRILTGNNGLYLPQEMARGADGPMAGYSYPEMLSGVCDLMAAGHIAEAHVLFNRHLPLLRYEAQGAWGIAVRKEVMRRRGALTSAALRSPGPVLTQIDLEEIDTLIAHMDMPAAGADRQMR